MASEWKRGGHQGPLLRLGQRVVHRKCGYRGAVAGWDPQCCEDDDWMQKAGVDGLTRGTQQPFYHVLVDVRDWDFDASQPPVAYAAEEMLTCPELEQEGMTWTQVYGAGDDLQHPYSYVLFLGADARGDMLPCRQLRDKYGVKRRDVYRPGTQTDESGDDNTDADDEQRGSGDDSNPKGPRIPGIDMSSLQ